MLEKLLLGLAGFLGIFLLIRILSKGKSSAPNNIQTAFDKAFDNSEYKATKQNWIDVSRMETAGWTSNLFLNNNNLWGMKLVKKRPTTQEKIGTQGSAGRNSSMFEKLFPNVNQLATQGAKDFLTQPINTGSLSTPSVWGKYKTVEDSAKDIILWMQYTKFPNSVLSLGNHVQQMAERKYFVGEEPSTYLSKIVAWKNRQ